MSNKPLDGKQIAVVVESQYIVEELSIYKERFEAYGAEVHFISRLWGKHSMIFVSEVEEEDKTPDTMEVHIDFTEVELNDYAAVIMAAGGCSDRLLWPDNQDVSKDASGKPIIHGNSGRRAPAVQFFYRAMMKPNLVKGFPCHALAILSPIPEVLAGRKVTCNRVRLGLVRNAGGSYSNPESGVVVDADMVTNTSAEKTGELVDAIRDQILAIEAGLVLPAVSAATTPSAKLSAEPAVSNPQARRILMLLSEWGYWGEELIGPLEEFDRVGYTTEFWTPTGQRPNAIGVSKLPPKEYKMYKEAKESGKTYTLNYSPYIDPPLGRSVTTADMALKVSVIDDSDTTKLDNPTSLRGRFPERPYWSDPQFVRLMEIYNQRLETAHQSLSAYDALIIVGGSGPIVDLANNQRVHDLIMGFYLAGKPIAAECYGVTCLAFARSIEDRKSIIWGKRVTGHCLEYDYKDGTGFMKNRDEFLTDNEGNIVNIGPPPYPLEYILRDATGPDGAFIGNFGHPTSVIVDYPFITGRSTPDSYLTGRKLIESLDGNPPLRRWGW